MARKGKSIPGLSFSWRRAIGLSAAQSRLSRKIWIPLSRSGRQRKIGRAMGCAIPLFFMISMFFLMFLSLIVPAHATGEQLPKFRNYPADPIYNRPHSPPDLSTRENYSFRTRLRVAAAQPVNFAGRYRLETWGCGAECITGAVVDLATGRVTFFPFSICCSERIGDDNFKPVQFRKYSRLVVFTGLRNEEAPDAAHFYEFTGAGFSYITSTEPFDDTNKPVAQHAGVYTCTPRDGGDIAKISVNISDDGWRVAHISRSGDVYDRMTQYRVTKSDTGPNGFWEGIHRRKQDTKIVGRLFIAAHSSTYEEEIFNTKDGLVAKTLSDCEPATANEANASSSGAQSIQEPARPLSIPSDRTPVTFASPPKTTEVESADQSATREDINPRQVTIPADPAPAAPEAKKLTENGSDNQLIIAGLLAIAIALALYFTPTIVATRREHMSIGSIFVVNLFFGWTLVGWVLSLAWALNSNTRRNMLLYRSLPTDHL